MSLTVLLLASCTLSAAAAQVNGTLSFPAFTADGHSVSATAEPLRDGVAQHKSIKAPAKLSLVPGKWTIRLHHGPHFRAVERDLEIRANENLDFGPVEFERVIDLRKRGWYAGRLGAEPTAEAEGLDWTAQSYSARGGQIGALGPSAGVPPNLERLPSHATLAAWQNLGAATFAGSLHAGLPFDLVAAHLVDGFVVTEGGEHSLAVWSMLLDHGYALAPVAGPQARLYVQCPAGATAGCLAEAVRRQRTIVSTGPILMAAKADARGIDVEAWARQDQPDRLLRVELWSHNHVIASRPATAAESQHLTATLPWIPQGAGDWVAVRLVSQSGWALSSAFRHEPPPTPALLATHLKMVFPEVASHGGLVATVLPSLPGAQPLRIVEVDGNALEVDVPVTALVRVELTDGRRIDTRMPEASGVSRLLEDLAGSDRTGEALLDWSVYEEVLRRCRRVVIESRL